MKISKSLTRLLLLATLCLVGWMNSAAALTFDASKFYSIKNVAKSQYLTLQTGYNETNQVNATPFSTSKGYFQIIPGSGSNYVLKSGDGYMALSTQKNWNTSYSNSPAEVWELEPVSGTANQYYIHSSHGYLKYDGTNNYAYTNGATSDGNKAKWTITEEQSNSATIICVDDSGRELQRETLSFFETTASVTAPAINGYDATGTKTATVRNGGSVTFRYVLHPYSIVYEFYDINNLQTRHAVENYSLTIGQPLPAPKHSCQGKLMAGVPTGTVASYATYRIYCYEEEGATEAQTITFAYAYYIDGVKCYTGESKQATVGEAFPALDTMPAGVSASRPTRVVTEGDAGEVRVDVTTNVAFKFAPAYDSKSAAWYKLNIGNDHRYFNYTANAANMVLATSADDSDKYLFTFVGNPFSGYSIYNRAAGASMVLSAPAPNPSSNEGKNALPVMKATPVASGYNTAWDIQTKNGGFLLSRHGESYYLNRRQDVITGSQVLGFWTSNAAANDQGSIVYMAEYVPGVTTVTTNPSCATPAAGKVYRLYSEKEAGQMIYENDSHELCTSNGKKQGDYSQMWVVETSATSGAYTLRNASTGRFVTLGNKNNVATTADAATPLYLTNKSGYYGIGLTADASGDRHLNLNSANHKVISWSLGSDTGSGWVFEEVPSAEATLAAIQAYVKTSNSYALLESGKYYRLKSYAYPTRYFTENYTTDSTVSGLTLAQMSNENAAIWRVEGNASTGYTLQNVFSGRYVADQSAQSQQFPTTASAAGAKKFFPRTEGGDAWSQPHYAFSRGSGTTGADVYSLHCAQNSSFKVVAWTYANESASFWNLEEVTLTDDQLTTIAQEYADFSVQKSEFDGIATDVATVNAKLRQYFDDYACTRLSSSYKRLSDAQFCAIASSDNLPHAVQQMMLSVKNDKWELDSERNRLTKLFRIYDYELYTDRSIWGTKTGVGPFAMFCNPTGITVKPGEIVYIYVDEAPADDDVKVGLYVAADTEYRTDTRIELHTGINAVVCPVEGEIIVDYRLANATKKWTDYPRLRVHIEGGQATGCWDASRGMTDADWQWLCDNAFEADFLHVKGEMTMLNLLTSDAVQARDERVSAIMKGWDYAFDGLQRMIGHDGQWDGYYRPMINPRHSYQGNPNWGGQSGSNHPTLARGGYLFRESNFTKDNIWEILHEEGHGHQGPINVAGSTEITNNSLSQCVSYELGVNYSRGENGAGHVELFNYKQGDKKGWSWVDYMRYATPYYDYSLHIGNQLLFRLYLYFKVTGIMPDFMPRLYDELRANGGIRKGSSVQNPTIWTNDYMKLALACCKVSQTDLSEFFETYGMFKYYEDVMSYREQDEDATAQAQHIRYIGDYGGYYMKMPSKTVPADVAEMNRCIAEMKSYPRKGDNIMFIEDRIKTDYVSEDALMAQIDPTIVGTEKRKYWNIGSQGDFGQYTDYATPPAASGINYTIGTATATQTVKAVDTGTQSTIQGRTITLTGDGLCGVKIYDKDGQLIYIANTRSFFVPTDVATKLQSGECTLAVALPDMSTLPLFKGEIGDMNRDGRVTIDDLAILIKALNVTTWKDYDLNDVSTLRGKVLKN